MSTNIREIQKQLHNIERMLDAMEEKSVSSSKQSVFDFTKMQNLGYRNRFVDHWTYKLDSDIRHAYEILLCAMISLAENQKSKICQYYFLTRVMDKEDSLQEMIQDACVSIDEKLDMLSEELSSDQIKLLMFDLLLMITMKGNPEANQLDYFCELQSYFSMDEKQMETIIKATSCVLKQEASQIFACARNFPVTCIACYLPIRMDYDIVTSIDELKSIKADNVVVYGLEFKNEEVNIDAYQAKSIEFFECKFVNCPKIYADKVNVEFKKCVFDSCSRKKDLEECDIGCWEIIDEESACKVGDDVVKIKDICTSIIETNHGIFEQCEFIKCQNINNPLYGNIVKMKEGEIRNCNFRNCRLEASALTEYTEMNRYNFSSLIYGEKLCVTGSIFDSCDIWGNGYMGWKNESVGVNEQFLQVIYIGNGSIEQCKFKKCKCDGKNEGYTKQYNYLINETSALVRENTYIDCVDTDEIGTAKWRIDVDK